MDFSFSGMTSSYTKYSFDFIHCLLIWLFFFPVTSQIPTERGYTGGKVVFIDTENTLYPCEPVSVNDCKTLFVY